MEHRICDFRNAKFQGQTIDKQPNGFGIILDENYTFVVGQLVDSSLIGPITVIFDDSSKLYGDLNDTNGLLVYADPMYKIFRNKIAVVIDYTNLKLLVKLQEVRVPSTPSRRSSTNETKMKVTAQKKYDQENYLNIVSELLESNLIPSKYLSYQNYIKQTFRTKYKNLLNFFQTSKQFSLSFRQEGIYMKIMKKLDVVASVGFNGSEKKSQIGRRYNYYRDFTNCLVQQFIQLQPSTFIQFDLWQKGVQQPNTIAATAIDLGVIVNNTHNKTSFATKDILQNNNKLRQKNRPKQCIKYLREYYKRSLTFLNKYLNLTQIYSLKQQFEDYFYTVNQMGVGRFAQNQIQNNGYKLDQKQNPIITKENQVIPLQAGLDEWKKQIQRTVSGNKVRRRPSNRSNIQDFAKQASRKVYENYQYKNSPQKMPMQPKYNEKLYTPQKEKEKTTDPERQNYMNSRSKSRRQIKYLDSQNEDRYERSQIPNTYKNSRNTNSRPQQNSIKKSPMHYKYSYIDQTQYKKRLPQTDYKQYRQEKKTYRY